ncbi:hypothetical protein E2C01_078585 [Portunus trituberculatus]|uniref:Uncharacterized protein n=1 Tax=Portunus trituberculatus TaxID=210409 RepID=A0A5B7IN76_PORTR|nr:hypothetical protein [Portunus trituberculatus]
MCGLCGLRAVRGKAEDDRYKGSSRISDPCRTALRLLASERLRQQQGDASPGHGSHAQDYQRDELVDRALCIGKFYAFRSQIYMDFVTVRDEEVDM